MIQSPLILANLLHLSYNMWGDWKNPKMGPQWCYQPTLRFDEPLWNELLEKMAAAKMNMVVIDVGDALQYKSHPEISIENAWSHEKMRSEIAKMRKMGLEPIPKLNFSACHDMWLGPYARMVSSKPYYQACQDVIAEVIDVFDKPRFFHLGMDEEEVHHQENFLYINSRKYDLWWRDVNFFLEQVGSKKVRPWVWSDYVWNHADEFYSRMPKHVLQSNWYREPIIGPAKSVYGGVINKDIKCCQAYIDLDHAGFDQLPTVSNWETTDNIYNTIKFCKENVSAERLKGFFLTPWKITLPVAREKHLEAIEHFGKAIKQFELA